MRESRAEGETFIVHSQTLHGEYIRAFIARSRHKFYDFNVRNIHFDKLDEPILCKCFLQFALSFLLREFCHQFDPIMNHFEYRFLSSFRCMYLEAH